MTLDICGIQKVISPSEQFLREAILNLDTLGDAYLILYSSDMTYVQCTGDKNIGFHLEYQDGSIDEHYQAVEGPLDTDIIILKFSEYAAGKPSWNDGVKWKKITF